MFRSHSGMCACTCSCSCNLRKALELALSAAASLVKVKQAQRKCYPSVATRGGAVIRPINWRYMKQGITVWLDVPLKALVRRIAAVGTDSCPLLHQESGDAYTKAEKEAFEEAKKVRRAQEEEAT
ncbi:uncharacterized protein LOC131230510 [Magnolia sinica]|uniref:uncharacterized protein LOC131230510 n=1 Tax=Magnolia sinica TaxID=86752 RepID=UPI002659577A|nr:uncharacterized protein LOC131230510 [Magnolia sinica]